MAVKGDELVKEKLRDDLAEFSSLDSRAHRETPDPSADI
jgi:hypothetical protein